VPATIVRAPASLDADATVGVVVVVEEEADVEGAGADASTPTLGGSRHGPGSRGGGSCCGADGHATASVEMRST
jgi:hypothetical protein